MILKKFFIIFLFSSLSLLASKADDNFDIVDAAMMKDIKQRNEDFNGRCEKFHEILVSLSRGSIHTFKAVGSDLSGGLHSLIRLEKNCDKCLAFQHEDFQEKQSEYSSICQTSQLRQAIRDAISASPLEKFEMMVDGKLETLHKHLFSHSQWQKIRNKLILIDAKKYDGSKLTPAQVAEINKKNAEK